ncbi:DNA translocase FtsK [Sulfurimonas lithotrophica]|uniref:DNA translocase FtsK n=1 Tax=Sulfurimonas lithotrophica TaxID=2590022 RepID=A0A5P8P139_9BACT|nr:DNA translocase FtsK 4TM domain-containing protein [Sulfurimonas lithotrophica]QFR49321.1 DNA translocase FtsK [Sulfurimonas lithotrophica]
MKEAIFILVFGILIYLGFATIFSDATLIGSYGAYFASINHKYFGYISYAYIFIFLIPLYQFYKDTTLDLRKFEIVISSFLLFFSFLLIQALLITDNFRGVFAGNFVDFLSPYIGSFGLWIFWLVISLVSTLIIFDKNTHEIISHFFEYIKSNKENNFQENIYSYEEEKNNETIQEEINEEEDDALDIETPTYFRNEEKSSSKIKIVKKNKEISEEDSTVKNEEKFEKPHNIVELASKIKEQKNALIVDELEENTKLLETIEKGKTEKPKNFTLPKIDFLQKPKAKSHSIDESELDEKIQYLIEKLAHFKIEGDVVRTYAGPVVSTFEFKPAANVKVSKILNLQDDLAMALSAETIRIQAPIPGKDVVGIEIPNEAVETIYLRELLDDNLFKESKSPLTIALGKDIVGKPFVTDLKKLPHLLIAGTTGSGKSVGINAMILSLLYKNSPDQLRLLMIDPKMLEFSIYNDIPHLLTPVITKPKQAIVALNNMVNEMERRYELMSDTRTKNIENYNEKAKKGGYEPFPYIVVVIDELADLMMTSGKDVEHSIARLAQMARASGIHLVVATQRPSVDVVTGLIKANLPSRISYRVGQKVDSKIILDQMGAESLLGKGDMLFTPPGAPALVRLHAPWSTEEEIEKIVEFIKSQKEPNYDKSFLIEEEEGSSSSSNDSYEELDELFEDAKRVVLNDRKTSISYLQRKLQVGYNRSARIIEQLEGEGILSAPNAKGMREIL